MTPEATAALRKAEESAALKQAFFRAEAEAVAACARAIAARLGAGGRVLTFGNGGSACDAQHLAVELLHPIHEKRRAFPAQALTTDTALLSAIGNDAEWSQAFVDQVALLARPEDVAVGFSTSGRSASVTRALRLARQRGLLTVALTGKDGGALPEAAEHCFVVPSFSIHRIQEVHVTLLHVLWDLVHLSLGAEDLT